VEDQEKLIEMIERYRIMVEVMQGYLSEQDLKYAMGDIAYRIQQELILGFVDDTETNNN
jgi:hypothetical protein